MEGRAETAKGGEEATANAADAARGDGEEGEERVEPEKGRTAGAVASVAALSGAVAVEGPAAAVTQSQQQEDQHEEEQQQSCQSRRR